MAMMTPFSMQEHRKAALRKLSQEGDPVRAMLALEALARLDAGNYGYCLACGIKIPEAKLESRPERRHCSACEGSVAA
jgi:RNA polymerase-binding transcription factor DksA